MSFAFLGRCAMIALCLILTLGGQAYAQRPHTSHCATMAVDSALRLRHPELGTHDAFERWLASKIDARRQLEQSSRSVTDILRIPIVIHVIHAGGAIGVGDNISQAQIMSQVRVLNEGFRQTVGTTGYSPDPRAADTKIEFLMARRTPAGLASDGIDRIAASSLGLSGSLSQTVFENTIKPATIWNPNQYLNIWVAQLGSGLLGYAQFPINTGLPGFTCDGWSGATGLANTDGVVMSYIGFGSDTYGSFPSLLAGYTDGKTLLHEIGHWAGLRHIWGDNDCGTDYCEDTPVTDGPSWTACHEAHPVPNACGTADEMFENYMDYGDDTCKNIFTFDQGLRMRTIITSATHRYQLLFSPGATPPRPSDLVLTALLNPGADSIAAAVRPRIRVRNTGATAVTSFTAGYRIGTATAQTQAITQTIAPGDSAEIDLNAATLPAGASSFTAFVAGPNGVDTTQNGLDTLSVAVRVGGRDTPYAETFEQFQFPPPYYALSGDQCYKWTSGQAVGGPLNQTSNAAHFRLDDDATFTTANSNFTTELFTLPAGTAASILSFSVAGTGASGGMRLWVDISTDGGRTYNATPLVILASDTLVTQASGTASPGQWSPTSNTQWRSIHRSLAGLQGQTVRLRFRSTLSSVSSLWIDNISLRLPTDPAPSITRLAPDSGAPGAAVRIIGHNLGQVLVLDFAGANAHFTNVSDTVIQTTVPINAHSGLVQIQGVGTSSYSPRPFLVLVPPAFSNFSPAGGPVGTVVTLLGRGFLAATAVRLGSLDAAYTILSDTSITMTVPANAVSGAITVVTRRGTVTGPGTFIVGNDVFLTMQNTTITTCSSILLDPGGAGNYGNNANVTMTIVPATPGSKVILTFNSFSTESSDYLDVYEGTGVSRTYLGYVSGSPSPLPTYISGAPGGEMTLVFRSNTSVTGEGFSANLGCIHIAAPSITAMSPVRGRPGTQVQLIGHALSSVRYVTYGSQYVNNFLSLDSNNVLVSPYSYVVNSARFKIATSAGVDSSALFEILPGTYLCSPHFTNQGYSPCGSVSISRVTIPGSTLHQSSGCEGLNYTVWPFADSATATFYGQTTVPLQVLGTTAGNASVWIDWNRDGYLSSAGEYYTADVATAGQYATLNIAVPTGYLPGVVVMRVRYAPTSGNGYSSYCDGTTGEYEDFTMTYAPSRGPYITSLTPGYGPIGTPVTVDGLNLDSLTALSFNGTPTAYTIVSPTRLSTTVPAGATTGLVSAASPRGTGFSPSRFLVGNVIVMHTGADTVCSGSFFDPGADGNYDNGLNITQTLYPATPGRVMQLDFSEFQTESGYDHLIIYDGPTTLSPVLGDYTGYVSAPFSVTASNLSGCLTMRFYSDGSVVASGFVASISCVVPPVLSITDMYPRFGAGYTNIGMTGTALQSVRTAAVGGTSVTPTYYSSDQRVYVQAPYNLSSANLVTLSNLSLSDTAPSRFYSYPVSVCRSNSSGCSTAVARVTKPGTAFRNSSGCGQANFNASQFVPEADSLRLTLRRGLTDTIQFTLSGNAYAGVFVDLDRSGTFDATEFYPTAAVGAGTAFTTYIAVPLSTDLGPVALRIATSNNQVQYYSACYFPYGYETEDYLAEVVPGDSNYIAYLSPGRGRVGQQVHIMGAGLGLATGALFNGVAATGFSVVSSTELLATVPAGAQTGPVMVTLPSRGIQSPGNFVVVNNIKPRVALLHSLYSNDVADVTATLQGFPDIGSVHPYYVPNIVPVLDTLLAYDVIVLAASSSLYNPLLLGNRLAQALQSGVSIVSTLNTTAGSSSTRPTGNWASHELISFDYNAYGQAGGIGTRQLPGHPLLRGIRNVWGTYDTRRPQTSTTVINNGYRVANWMNGAPLAVARDGQDGQGRRVDLGYFPVRNSIDYYGYADTSGGAALLHNAVIWASGFQAGRGILSFDPDTAGPGLQVHIYGNMPGLQSIQIAGQSVSFTQADSLEAIFTVPDGIASGRMILQGLSAAAWRDTSETTLYIAPRPMFTSAPVLRGKQNNLYTYAMAGQHPWTQRLAFNKQSGPAWLSVRSELSDCRSVAAAAGGQSGSTDGPLSIATLSSADGLLKLPDGRIAFSDYVSNRVRFLEPGVRIGTLAGTGSAGHQDGPLATATFNGPDGLAKDPAGNLYVVDYGNNCIRKITPQGTVSTLAGSLTGISGYADGPGNLARFSQPLLMCYADGYLYLTERGNQDIRKIDMLGNTTTLAGGPASGYVDGPARQARFYNPTGLAMSAAGILYVADGYNNCIRAITPTGIVSTLTGSAASGMTNGPLAQARFNYPLDLAIDSAQNLIVTDYFNYMVRYVNLRTGQVGPMVGTGYSGSTDGPAGTATLGSVYSICLAGNGLLIGDGSRIRQLDVRPSYGTMLAGIPPAAGTYPVQVRVSSPWSTDTVQGFDLVVSNCANTTLPSVTGDTSCASTAFQISAVGTGPFNWYATETSTAPFATGPVISIDQPAPGLSLYLSQQQDSCESPRLAVYPSIVPLAQAQFSQQRGLLRYARPVGSPHAGQFQWLLGGSAIAGATDSLFIVNQAGFYQLVTRLGPCVDTSNAQNVTVLSGKERLAGRQASLHPNPASSRTELLLTGPGWAGNQTGALMDLQGKALRTYTLLPGANTLDLDGLAKGLYYLRLHEGITLKLEVE